MRKVELQCLMVGRTFKDYPGLANMLGSQNVHTNLKQVGSSSAAIKHALKHLQGASLVFLPEEYYLQNQSKNVIQVFADLVWQYASDTIIVVLSQHTQEDDLTYNLNEVQMSVLNYDQHSSESKLRLQFIVQTALLKFDFRRCKRLLGVSEKRCQWLLDSSVVPIANISRNLHLYANSAYLNLLGVNSLQALRSLSVKDFISSDEHTVYDSFIRSQLKKADESQSLFLHMKTKKGLLFRTNIRVIPSVFNSKRCLQLWVNSVPEKVKTISEVESIWEGTKSITATNSNLGNHRAKSTTEINSPTTVEKDVPVKGYNATGKSSVKLEPASILKEIINRKEAHIFTQKLVDVDNTSSPNTKNIPYYLISLVIPFSQRRAVDDLLMEISHEKIKTLRSLFWDKVKLTRLFQTLSNKHVKNTRLLMRLSEETIHNPKQLMWIKKSLNQIRSKASMIMFLVPSRLDEAGQRACVKFILELRAFGCEFALDDYFINSQSLILLKHAKPQAIRLYLPWLKSIEGKEEREIALGRFISQMKVRNIKIIVPCDFSQDMKKLFILSGASFCQERIRKNA